MGDEIRATESAGEEPRSGSQQRVGRPLAKTVKRMDCPSVMREHLWSIERDGMIECLWCFERRRAEDRERPTVPFSDCAGGASK